MSDAGEEINFKNNKNKIKFVRTYIVEKVVKGYIIADLQRLLDIPVIPDKFGNCNFPIALFTFSCMDFLGYLISETEYSLIGDTKNRIEACINILFSKKSQDEIEPYKNEFVDKFRHGLTHEFFPKMSGISRKNKTLMSLTNKGHLILDADVLANMFIESLKRFQEMASEDTFCLRIFDRYKKNQDTNSDKDIPRKTYPSSPASLATVAPTPSQPPEGDS